MEEFPKISVVVPVRNEAQFIATTIETILLQDYPGDCVEILVAVGESDDNTAEIVSSLAQQDGRIRFLNNPGNRSSAGRNIGAQNATGDIITFIDGHTYVSNNQLFKNIVHFVKNEGYSVLSRPQFLDTPHNNFFQRAVSIARKSVIGHGLDSTIYSDEDMKVDPTSSGATYRREVFEKVGYFDERFDACEDVEFNYRTSLSGYDSFSSMKLAVFYYPRDSLKDLFNQMKRYGVGRFRLARKHPKTLSLGTLIPFFITIGLPLLGLLSLANTIFLWLFLLGSGLYLLPILGCSLALSVKNGLKNLLILPAIYPAIHFGLGWGFLLEMFRTLAGRGVKFGK